MSELLKQFLIDLASDPTRMTSYAADPRAAIDAAGLSATDRDALLSRDGAALRAALGGSGVDHMTKIRNGHGGGKGKGKGKGKKTAKKKTGKK